MRANEQSPVAMDLNSTITLDDYLKMTGPMAFNLMIKPVGSLCNLDCKYCYYLDKTNIYGGKEPRMSIEMLEKFVKAYIDANDVPEVSFNWHGGEPLLMGMDFYRSALDFQKKYSNGKVVHNTIQTNGTLINQEWAAFLRDNDFLVGISIDGPDFIHNRYRKDKEGLSTFDKVIRGVECLYRANVQYNTMTTVNKESEGKGLEVYMFMKSIGSHYMQFMPVVEHIKYPVSAEGKELKHLRPIIVSPDEIGSRIAPWSVSSMGFGKFMCDIFDYWVRNDVGTYFVNLFDATLAGWCGAMPGTCVFSETCGGNSIVEHNGDVYACDHFVYPEYKLGNLLTDDMRGMMTSVKQQSFGINKRNGLPRKCRNCTYFFACHGECPKHRFGYTGTGEKGLNVLCEGYYHYFGHAAPYMDYMKDLLLQKKSPAGVIPWARCHKI